MSLFDIFAPKNPFRAFEKKVLRLRALLNVMEQEAQREHFEQLKGHFHAVQKLLGSQDSLDRHCIIRLFLEEKQKTKSLHASEDKQKLEQLENETEQALIGVVRCIHDGIIDCDYAIASRQNIQELQRYKKDVEKKISYLEQFTIEIEQRAPVIKKLVDEIERKESALPIQSRESVTFSGRMSNGFTGGNIQCVIRQLSGYIIASSGRHPYKIIFPGKGQLGFSFTMNPLGFLKQVAHITGIEQKILENAFRNGKL